MGMLIWLKELVFGLSDKISPRLKMVVLAGNSKTLIEAHVELYLILKFLIK